MNPVHNLEAAWRAAVVLPNSTASAAWRRARRPSSIGEGPAAEACRAAGVRRTACDTAVVAVGLRWSCLACSPWDVRGTCLEPQSCVRFKSTALIQEGMADPVSVHAENQQRARQLMAHGAGTAADSKARRMEEASAEPALQQQCQRQSQQLVHCYRVLSLSGSIRSPPQLRWRLQLRPGSCCASMLAICVTFTGCFLH